MNRTQHEERTWARFRKQTSTRWATKDVGYVFALGLLFGMLVSMPVHATELVHKFKNPSFSGVGAGAHYLTIENQEKTRREKIKDDIEAKLREAERDAENTTLAKFLRNLESRIYSQISKQLVDSMFGNEEGADYGVFTIEGNTVTYERVVGEDGIEIIRMTIVAQDGSSTVIDIPVGVGNLGG